MKWFKHDADASIDAKLQELLLDYGASGYGLYWYCIELIAGNTSENNITFELEHDVRIIARNLNLSLQETKDMMQKMIDLNLFSISSNDRLACYALAKRLDSSMTSSPRFRSMIKKVKDNHDIVMTKSCKKRREEKRIDYIQSDVEDIQPKEIKKSLTKSTQYENTSNKYKEMLKEYCISKGDLSTYEHFIDFHVSKGNKFKDWTRAFNTWLRNSEKFNPKEDKGRTVDGWSY